MLAREALGVAHLILELLPDRGAVRVAHLMAAKEGCGVTTVQRLALALSTLVQLVKRKNSLHGCGGGAKMKSRAPMTAVTTAIVTEHDMVTQR